MRRLLVIVLVVALAGCSLRRANEPPPSPYCRSGDPLAGVYHPSRLHVRSRCRIASGTVAHVKFEEYDGDVHIQLRPDDASLVSRGNDQIGGNLVVEIIPQDRARVPVPAEGERVTVVGPWVDDETHDWREIHPAWYVSTGAIHPASSDELRRVSLLLRGFRSARAGGEDD